MMAAKKTHYTVINEGHKIYEGMLSIQDTKKVHVWTPLYCQLVKEDEHLYFLAHKTNPPTGKPIEFTNIIRCTTEICPPGHATPRPSEKDTHICIQSPEGLTFVRASNQRDREELTKHIRNELNLTTAAIYDGPFQYNPYATKEYLQLPTTSSYVQQNPLPNVPEETKQKPLMPVRPAPMRPLISAEQYKRRFDSEKFEAVQLQIDLHTQVISYAFFNNKAYYVNTTKASQTFEVCTLHPGDEILKVNETEVNPQSLIANILSGAVEETQLMTVKRAPFGKMVFVCLKPKQNIVSLGMNLRNTEVIDFSTDGLIAKTGTLPGPRYENIYGIGECNWALTEINGRIVPFGSGSGKVKDVLKNAGRHLALLFQPAAFIQELSSTQIFSSDISPY